MFCLFKKIDNTQPYNFISTLTLICTKHCRSTQFFLSVLLLGWSSGALAKQRSWVWISPEWLPVDFFHRTQESQESLSKVFSSHCQYMVGLSDTKQQVFNRKYWGNSVSCCKLLTSVQLLTIQGHMHHQQKHLRQENDKIQFPYWCLNLWFTLCIFCLFLIELTWQLPARLWLVKKKSS